MIEETEVDFVYVAKKKRAAMECWDVVGALVDLM